MTVATLVLTILAILAVVVRYVPILAPVVGWLPPKAQWVPAALSAAAAIGIAELPKCVTAVDLVEVGLKMAVCLALAAAAGLHAPPAKTDKLGATMRGGTVAILLGVGLCLAGPAVVTSCAAVLPAIAQIAAIVSDASNVLDIIDAAAKTFFAEHPDAQLQAKYAQLAVKARASLAVAQHSLSGAKDMSQEDYDRAFAEFRQAYGELVDLLSAKGVVRRAGQPGLMGATQAVEVPEPMALTYRVQR